MQLVKCPFCSEEIYLTEQFKDTTLCPYCKEKIDDLASLPIISEKTYHINKNNPSASSRKFLTPLIIDFVYWLLVVGIVLIGLQFSQLWLKLTIIIISNIILRLYYESLILFFSFHEQVVLQNKQSQKTNELLGELLAEVKSKNENTKKSVS